MTISENHVMQQPGTDPAPFTETVFIPSTTTMAHEHAGLLVSELGEDGGEGFIVVGTLDPALAVAAIRHYLATEVDWADFTWATDEFVRDLADGAKEPIAHTTVFTTREDGGWNAVFAEADAASAVPAVWIVSPRDPYVVARLPEQPRPLHVEPQTPSAPRRPVGPHAPDRRPPPTRGGGPRRWPHPATTGETMETTPGAPSAAPKGQ
ncbi:hypothetical protein [Streptomyces sp. NPDC087297]|uniref:hypothetical protein n=1 Tax=Streptomyces sp. NPDC087297 TaxID=3365778 RepID=UPI0038204331